MRKLSAAVALVVALQPVGQVVAARLFVCPSCGPSATWGVNRDAVILVRGGGGGGGMRLDSGAMSGGGMGGMSGGMGGASGGGMGGMSGGMGGASGGGMGGLFGFQPVGCPEHRPKSAARHAEPKPSSCSN
jgi:hypothetical protein